MTSSPSAAHLEAAGHLLESFGGLQRRIRALATEVARATGLRPQHVWLLAVLDNLGEVRVAVVAKELFVDPSVASRQIGYLEEEGYVVRRTDPEDARAFLVSLTTQGHRALQWVREVRRSFLARATSDWKPDRLTELAEAIETLGAEVTELLNNDGLAEAEPPTTESTTREPATTEATPRSEASRSDENSAGVSQ